MRGDDAGSERGEHGVSDRRLGLFYTLCGLFLLAMYAVLLARNLGYLWIAMEATTLMSAPLVSRVCWAVIDRNARKGKQPSDHAPVVVDLTD